MLHTSFVWYQLINANTQSLDATLKSIACMATKFLKIIKIMFGAPLNFV